MPDPHLVEKRGPWPFITWRVFRSADGREHVWSARHHRKGLLRQAATEASKLSSCLWMPGELNWWIGLVFAIGSLLFAVASVLSLVPSLAQAWLLDAREVNAVFFAGSIPFTTAAYLQLFQAANATPFSGNESRPNPRRKLFGWRPQDVGWLSCALQFIGTILFNFNTFDAMIPSLNWFQQDLMIWVPNLIGSVLFLASGYMAFIETCHSYWAWLPGSLSWWVVLTNLLGCVGFMISAAFAIFLPGTPDTGAVTISLRFTLLGAIGFLVGSLLMLPEAVPQTES